MDNAFAGPLFQNQLITIRWGDGYIRVEPESALTDLKRELTYYHRTISQKPRSGKSIQGEYRKLYESHFHVDDDQNVANYLVTLPGFMHRIKSLFDAQGYNYKVIDERTPMPPMDVKKAMSGLYAYQYEPVLDLLLSGGGIASCPTGFGKTHLMAAIARAYDPDDLQVRSTPLTVFAASDKDVTRKNYEDFCEIFPDRDVGIMMSGRTKRSEDIQVITLDSLHRIDPEEVGLLIIDEVHSAGTDARTKKISECRKAAKWGFSATPFGRFDGGDLKTEGLVGPAVVDIPYSKGVEVGALVPITVYYLNCPEPPIGVTSYQRYKSRHKQVQVGIEGNDALNDLVVEIFQRLPEETQAMAIMPHIYQIDELKKRMPDVQEVHGETSQDSLIQKGYHDTQAIGSKQREQIYRDMASGDTKRIIATYVYKQGVNFPQLEVMICPGGGGSKLVSGQVPGRASRRIAGKDKSFIVDFWHPWDTVSEPGFKEGRKKDGPLLRDDRARDKVYEKLGFNRVWVDSIDELPFIPAKT